MNIKRLVIRKYRVLDRLNPQKVKIDQSSSNFLPLFRLKENTPQIRPIRKSIFRYHETDSFILNSTQNDPKFAQMTLKPKKRLKLLHITA